MARTLRAGLDVLMGSYGHLMLVAVAALSCWHPVYESDVFWHLSLGRAVLESGTRTPPEVLAWSNFASQSVVPEWLWSLVTLGVQRAAGFQGLTWFAVLLGGAAGWSTSRLARKLSPEGPGLAFVVVSLCVVAMTLRAQVRPQLAFLTLLPGMLWGARSYRDAVGGARIRLGIALVVLCVLWAQLHGSFVLAPVVFLLYGATLDRPARTLDGMVLLGLCLALLSSAYGIHVLDYLWRHGAGDAKHYVHDMMAPDWTALNPLERPMAAALWALWGLGGAAVWKPGRLATRELALCVLGFALFITAHRFLSAAAVLVCPLAIAGGQWWRERLLEIPAARATVLRIGAATWVFGLVIWSLLDLHAERGPLGAQGLAKDRFPVRAAAALSALPSGSPVLTEFAAGGPVGFYARGQLRVFIDSRTPLFYDDAAFGLSRDMFRDAGTLKRALAHYKAQAAVVRRDSLVCPALAQDFEVATLEPVYSTFAAEGSKALTGLRPCGAIFIDREKCDAVPSAIGSLESTGADAAFLHLLRAEHALHCLGVPQAALKQLAKVPDWSPVLGISASRVRVLALSQLGRPGPALRLLEEAFKEPRARALFVLSKPELRGHDPRLMRKLLSTVVEELGDATPALVRAGLAQTCAELGDVRCAWQHGLRSAAQGEVAAVSSLLWIASHHDSRSVRRDAARWARRMASQAAQPPATDP